MKRTPLLLLLFAGLLLPAAGWSADRTPKSLQFIEEDSRGPVYVVPVKGMIDVGLARYIERAIEDAEAANASLILFDVDTFGGLVDAADGIRKSILNAKVPTLAFIDRNAASAGALISYAADRIVMVPGASIGAATVVEGAGGGAAPDKYQSYMRGLMRATAEANGRDAAIAEAMVDEDLEVEGVSLAGQVLTLSANEANRLGVADAILDSKEAVLREAGLEGVKVIQHHSSFAEEALRFLGSPVLQSLFMLMMLGGLYFEFQSPGVGFPGLAALFGAAFFFAPSYLLGLVESWEIVLFVIGVALLMAEIFIIPGFGVAGITGIVLIVGSLLAALVGNVGLQIPSATEFASAVGTMAATLVLFVILIFSLGRYLPRTSRFNHLVLATEPSLHGPYGWDGDRALDFVGATGTALTPLRPSGVARIGGERVDVITSGEFVPTGTPVEVVSVRGSRVEVRPVSVTA